MFQARRRYWRAPNTAGSGTGSIMSLREAIETLQAHGLDPDLGEMIESYIRKRKPWLASGAPWMTKGCTAWLEANLAPMDRVLEYGGGKSTLWWASRVGRVTCVEASPNWTLWILMYAYTRPELLKKLRFFFCPAEWNPSFPKGVKGYWKKHFATLTDKDVVDLESDLDMFAFAYPRPLVADTPPAQLEVQHVPGKARIRR